MFDTYQRQCLRPHEQLGQRGVDIWLRPLTDRLLSTLSTQVLPDEGTDKTYTL